MDEDFLHNLIKHFPQQHASFLQSLKDTCIWDQDDQQIHHQQEQTFPCGSN